MARNVLVSRARGWCFTANLPEDEEVDVLTSAIPKATYCCYQYESGTHRHIQGYVWFNTQRLGSTVKKIIKDWCGIEAHLEIAKGTAQQNLDYCSKVDTRIDGTEPQAFGEIPQQGARTDLVTCWDVYKEDGLTEEILETYPQQLLMYGNRMKSLREEKDAMHWKHRAGFFKKEVVILWGESDTGKTREAAERGAVMAKYESRYTWGHYRGEPVVCFDEFNGQVSVEEMLTLCDGYNATVQIPYLGNKPWIPNTIYICSNSDYMTWWEKAKPVQLQAFWRRVTKCVKFTKTELGVLKQWQKGAPEAVPIDALLQAVDEVVVARSAPPAVNERVTADNDWQE